MDACELRGRRERRRGKQGNGEEGRCGWRRHTQECGSRAQRDSSPLACAMLGRRFEGEGVARVVKRAWCATGVLVGEAHVERTHRTSTPPRPPPFPVLAPPSPLHPQLAAEFVACVSVSQSSLPLSLCRRVCHVVDDAHIEMRGRFLPLCLRVCVFVNVCEAKWIRRKGETREETPARPHGVRSTSPHLPHTHTLTPSSITAASPHIHTRTQARRKRTPWRLSATAAAHRATSTPVPAPARPSRRAAAADPAPAAGSSETRRASPPPSCP